MSFTRTSGAVMLAVVVSSGDTVEVRVLAPLDADTGRKLAVWRPPGSGNTWPREEKVEGEMYLTSTHIYVS